MDTFNGGNKIRVIKKDINGNDIKDSTTIKEQKKSNVIDENNFGKIIQLDNQENNSEDKNAENIEYFMFMKIFENDFLKKIPVSLQSDYNIQKEIKRKVDQLYSVRKEGLNIKKYTNKYNKKYNSIIDNINKGELHLFKWLYPVVLDEKVIYSLTIYEEDEENNDSEEKKLKAREIEKDYAEVVKDIIEEIKNITDFYIKLQKKEITYISFLREVNKYSKSFLPPSDEVLQTENKLNIKILDNIKKRKEVIRYINRKNEKAKLRTNIVPFDINTFYPGKKKESNSVFFNKLEENNILIRPNEKLYVVGFIYIPQLINSDLLFSENNKDFSVISLINEATSDEKYPDDKKEFELNTPFFIKFNKKKLSKISSNDYLNLLEKLVPTCDKIIDFMLKNEKIINLNKIYTEIQKWGYGITDIEKNTWNNIINHINSQKYENKETIIENENNEIQYDTKLFEKIYDNKNITIEQSIDKGDTYHIYNHYDYFLKNKKDIAKLNKSTKNIIKNNLYDEFHNLFLEDKFDIKTIEKNFISNKFKNINEIIKTNEKERLLSLLRENVKNNSKYDEEYKKQINNKFLYIKNYNSSKYFSKFNVSSLLKETIEHETENKTENKTKNNSFLSKVPLSIQTILEDIKNNHHPKDVNNILFKIIELDGILIGDILYSNYYKAPMMCGHWYYLMLISKANNNLNKKMYVSKLLTKFSTKSGYLDGEDFCKHCGKKINNLKMTSKDVYIETKYQKDERYLKVYYKHSKPLLIVGYGNTEFRKCNSVEFEDEIKSRNLETMNDLNNAKYVCRILNTIFNQTGIKINNQRFIELIIVIVKEAKDNILNKNKYYDQKIKEIQIERKISDEYLESYVSNEKVRNFLKKSYDKYKISRFNSLIFAHVLWHLRTTIPVREPTKNIEGVSYFGFSGEDGTQYILKLATKLKLTTLEIKVGDKIVKGRVAIDKIESELRYWLSILKQKYAYALLLRKEHEQNVTKKNIITNQVIQIIKKMNRKMLI